MGSLPPAGFKVGLVQDGRARPRAGHDVVCLQHLAAHSIIARQIDSMNLGWYIPPADIPSLTRDEDASPPLPNLLTDGRPDSRGAVHEVARWLAQQPSLPSFRTAASALAAHPQVVHLSQWTAAEVHAMCDDRH